MTWNAIPGESALRYYEVNVDPTPATVLLPRRVLRAAGSRTARRVLSINGLPPDVYVASVTAVADGGHGPVSSPPSTTASTLEVTDFGMYARTTTAAAARSIGLAVVVLAGSLGPVLWIRESADPVGEAKHAAFAGIFAGLVTGAFVEMVKRLSSVRGIFHKRLMHSYFGELTETLTTPTWGSLFVSPRPLHYDTPVAQLAAQISELRDRAFVDPATSVPLLRVLSGDSKFDYSRPSKDSGNADGDAELISLRGRIDARIDGFQISATTQWQRSVRLTACLLSAGIGMLIGAGIGLNGGGIYAAAVAGLTLGGVLSWVVGDLLASVERLGRT